MRSAFLRLVPILPLLGITMLSGCGSSPNAPAAPGIQPQITNAIDNFGYQVSSVQNYTGSATYLWRNTGSSASVNQATAVTAGIITVTLSDSTGAQVYTRSLSDNGTFSSTTGAPGLWRVRLFYSGATATVNFRAQKL